MTRRTASGVAPRTGSRRGDPSAHRTVGLPGRHRATRTPPTRAPSIHCPRPRPPAGRRRAVVLVAAQPVRRSTGPVRTAGGHAQHRTAAVRRPRGPLVGRGGRIVNINGRRADLRAVESSLRAAVPAAAPVCLLVDAPVRGEWCEVLARGGPEARQAVEEAAFRLLPHWQTPRAVRADAHRPCSVSAAVCNCSSSCTAARCTSICRTSSATPGISPAKGSWANTR